MIGPTARQADARSTQPARGPADGQPASSPGLDDARLSPSLSLVPRGRGRKRRGPALFASVLAHAALIVLVLLLLHRRTSHEPAGREQSVAMMFEPAPTPQAPRPGLPAQNRPGAVPPPTSPPVPDAPPTAEPPLPEPPLPPAAPPQSTAAPATPPSAPPATAEAPAPPTPDQTQDEVNLQPPPMPQVPDVPDMPAPVPIPAAPTPQAASPSTAPAEPSLAGTVPPPASRLDSLPQAGPQPLPQPMARPPRPQPQREAALSPPLLRPPHAARPSASERPRLARPTPPGSFPAPMNYSFAPPSHAAPQSVARSMLQPPAPSDSQPGLGARSSAGMLETFARAREGDPGPDFYASLKSWWLAHRFYPPQAIEAGEDGDVQISLIVDRQGRVTEVQMESRSGSMWLDMAGQSTWRNAKLLPIPDSMGRDRLTIDLTLHYMLIRR